MLQKDTLKTEVKWHWAALCEEFQKSCFFLIHIEENEHDQFD